MIGCRYNNVHQDRYDTYAGREGVPNAPFEYRAATLENEADNGGWLPNNRPTGPAPMDLLTIGMRGEPGYDDDADWAPDGRGFTRSGRDGDNTSWD
jgi:hypothetical protein